MQVVWEYLVHEENENRCLDKGDTLQIQKLLGHESLAVTSIYTHTNMEALSEAVNMF